METSVKSYGCLVVYDTNYNSERLWRTVKWFGWGTLLRPCIIPSGIWPVPLSSPLPGTFSLPARRPCTPALPGVTECAHSPKITHLPLAHLSSTLTLDLTMWLPSVNGTAANLIQAETYTFRLPLLLLFLHLKTMPGLPCRSQGLLEQTGFSAALAEPQTHEKGQIRSTKPPNYQQSKNKYL